MISLEVGLRRNLLCFGAGHVGVETSEWTPRWVYKRSFTLFSTSHSIPLTQTPTGIIESFKSTRDRLKAYSVTRRKYLIKLSRPGSRRTRSPVLIETLICPTSELDTRVNPSQTGT